MVSAARDPEDSTGNSTLTPAQSRGRGAESLQVEVRDQEACRRAGGRAPESICTQLSTGPLHSWQGPRTSCRTLCLFPHQSRVLAPRGSGQTDLARRGTRTLSYQQRMLSWPHRQLELEQSSTHVQCWGGDSV